MGKPGRPPKDPARLTPHVEDHIAGPRPLAYALSLSDRHLRKLATDGVVIRQGKGSYWFVRSVRNYVEFLRNGGEERAEQPGRLNFDDAKARKMLADAERSELILMEAAGQLVKSADVAKTWDDMLGRLRSKLLALPGKMAAVVQDEHEFPVIESLLRGAVEEALSELAAIELPGEAGRDIQDVSPGPAAKANGRRVGRKGKAAQS